MKRSFTILTAAFMLLAFLAIPMGMMGQTSVTWPGTTALPGTATAVANDQNITIMVSSTNTYTNPIRIYANTTVTIEALNGAKILSVNYEASSTGNYVTVAENATVTPEVTPTVSGKNVTWTYAESANVTEFTFKPSAQTRSNGITITYTMGSSSTVATPTFNPAGGGYTTTQNVTISCETEGSTIFYTTDGSTPDNTSTQYNGAITVSETTTINAIAYVGTDASSVATATYTIVNLEHAGTEADPYSVADARTAIDANVGITGVYATGIVSAIPTAYNSSYGNVTFNMVDEEGDEVFLQAFRCTGDEAANVAVGDVAVVYGNLTKYGSTYEFGQGCQLVSLVHPASTEPSITVTPATLHVEAGQHVVNDELTITFDNIDVVDYESFTIQFYNAEGEGQEMPEWLVLGVLGSNDEGYQVNGYISANESEARSSYFKVHVGETYSNLVTINQAAPVVPPTPGNWVLTDLADLTEDDVFVIVGTANGNTYAMPNVGECAQGAPCAIAVTVVEGTLSEEPDEELQWNLGIAENGYIFYPNGDTENWLYCINNNNGVRVGDNVNNVFTMGNDGYLQHTATSRYVGIYNAQDWRCYTNTTGNIAGQTFAFYKKVEAPATETHTLTIDGYTDDNIKNGYYLIASPVTVNPADVEGLTEGDFDLYYYDDTQDLEWINYETQDGINADFGNLIPGQGYLYAKKATTENPTYSFNLTGVPYSGHGEIDLIAGWNLVGNPFGQEAEISMDYYAMNQDGSELTPVTASTNVAAMQGVFVYSEVAGTVMFMPAETGTNAGDDKLVLNVTRNRGTVIDRAIVRFGQGGMLPKFQLNENNTKISIVEGETEYAVVRSANEGEMPVSFKASENGRYTISVNAENIEMEYLHLIDNMTGADVDLLATPSYSFEANTTDYANRFKLVFVCGDANDDNDFAFFNGSNWVVNNEGEATLQVIDMTGRILSSEQINGSYNKSLNLSAGVYVLRLSNGNVVKTQKVVID